MKQLIITTAMGLMSLTAMAESPKAMPEMTAMQAVKVLQSEISVSGKTVMKDGQPYTGSFWSNDGKSMFFKCENGKVIRWIVFYDSMKMSAMYTEGEGIIYYRNDGNHVTSLTGEDAAYYKKVKATAPKGLID